MAVHFYKTYRHLGPDFHKLRPNQSPCDVRISQVLAGRIYVEGNFDVRLKTRYADVSLILEYQ